MTAERRPRKAAAAKATAPPARPARQRTSTAKTTTATSGKTTKATAKKAPARKTTPAKKAPAKRATGRARSKAKAGIVLDDETAESPSTPLVTSAVTALIESLELGENDEGRKALAALALSLALQLDIGVGMATAAVARELRATLHDLEGEGSDDGDHFRQLVAALGGGRPT